ncbi:MAG TPA: HAMP domain-containing sensor histidine kinase [Acidimicrobiales bacterium]|nr:HAMP domain-containing sensor histidine kinase [Acidimicrobiales bacterium]
MTLRLRLVAALFALLLAGLALFGLASTTVYARSQYQRLDDEMRSSAPFVTRQLQRGDPGFAVGPRPDHGPGGRDPDGDDRSPGLPYTTYSELRGTDGKVMSTGGLSSATSSPSLREVLTADKGRFFTTGSTSGSGQWRVYAGPVSGGGTVVVAVPTGAVGSAVHRLVLIEVAGGALLLLVLCGGAWVILRRGLRPLEQMAGTAGHIAAGDLSQRVADEGPPEIHELGSALNTMLDRIEAAFAEREATEQRLRQFLADASHELRTPLTSIQGFAELARIGEHDRVDMATVVRRIEEESARMKGLVEDLLLLARLDQTRPVEFHPVDMAVLAADACSDAVAADPGRPVTLDAPAVLAVEGDEPLLRQALANLVTNAVRHTPAGSPIEVAARAVDGRAEVVVRDHGTGLDDEALAHVFDRFWQADRARKGKGSGLGLSIVAGIAAEHGGTVTAANADGGGARFVLSIPST